MAGADSIRATKAVVEFGGDLAPLKEALSKASKAVTDWGKSIGKIGIAVGAAGAAITAPFLAAMSGFEETGSEIAKTARITGMSFGEVQDAMAGTKASAEELQGATRVMNNFLASVNQGSPEALQMLDQLGLSADELAKATQHERLLKLADGINRIGDAAARGAAQVKVFGRGAMGLNLAGGAAGIQQRATRAEEIGGKLSDSDVELAKELGKAQKEVAASAKGIWNQVGAAAAPVMIRFFKLITDIQIGVRKWAEENRPLLTTIFEIGDKLALAGAAIGALGAAIIGVGAAINFIFPALMTMKAIFAAIFSVAALKIIAVVAVLALVGYGLYELYQRSETFREGLSAWVPIIQDFAATFMQVWGGISDAIAGGDLGLAWEILVTGLKLYWVRFVNWIRGAWFDFKYLFIATLGDVYNQGVEIFWNLAKAIAKAFVWVGGRIVDALNAALGAIPDWAFDLLGITPGAQISFDEARLNANADRNAADAIASGRVNERDAAGERNAERDRAAAEEAGIQNSLDDAAYWAMVAKESRIGTATAVGSVGAAMMQNVGSISAGGFSAAAVLGQLGGSHEQKMLSAAEDTAANTERIADRLEGFGVAE